VDLPEITSVQKLTIKPGDRLVVTAAGNLTPEGAELVRERVRAALDLDQDVKILVLGSGDVPGQR
jgi:hypothetical protein